MKKIVVLLIVAVLAVAAVFAVRKPKVSAVAASNNSEQVKNQNEPRKTLRAFASEQELKNYFRELAEKQRRETEKRRALSGANMSNSATATADSAAPAAERSVSAAKSAAAESITNTQHAGVDEGGIVKLHGEHLVILRRGRLFTVKIGDNDLRHVAAVDAFAPGVNARGDWYDEMLVSGDTVAVIGYSYQRGGTEINLFDINRDGALKYRSTYHLRSNDYYSSRNYASRLIGTKLVFYTPQYLNYYDENPISQFPALRRWHKGATADEFQLIVAATKVYRTDAPTRAAYGAALHTITVCDLANADFKCEATGVVGAPGRVFYVSPTSVYVWTTDWNYDADFKSVKTASMLYKMPLDGGAPSALGVAGSPVDQFSFLESKDNHLNVLVRSDAGGEAMWNSEAATGDVALFRTPLENFSDGSQTADASRYRALPKPAGYTFQNRFVGDFLLYGTGSGWGEQQAKNDSNLYAVQFATGEVNTLKLQHSVDRIEAVGDDAVIVGTKARDLYFSPVSLNATPILRQSYIRKNAAQGELRSHGFFYKPEDNDSGLLGLPIARQGRAGYKHLIENSAAIIFLRNNRLNFSEAGELAANAGRSALNDNCRASCVDWYGNARPLFIRGRIFALLGYEIVEGNLSNNRIAETRRLNYTPNRPRKQLDSDE